MRGCGVVMIEDRGREGGEEQQQRHCTSHWTAYHGSCTLRSDTMLTMMGVQLVQSMPRSWKALLNAILHTDVVVEGVDCTAPPAASLLAAQTQSTLYTRPTTHLWPSIVRSVSAPSTSSSNAHGSAMAPSGCAAAAARTVHRRRRCCCVGSLTLSWRALQAIDRGTELRDESSIAVGRGPLGRGE